MLLILNVKLFKTYGNSYVADLGAYLIKVVIRPVLRTLLLKYVSPIKCRLWRIRGKQRRCYYNDAHGRRVGTGRAVRLHLDISKISQVLLFEVAIFVHEIRHVQRFKQENGQV